MVLSFLQQSALTLNNTGTVVLLLWIPATLFAFLYMKPWRAIVLAHIVGFCVLPHGEIYVPALPDVDRVMVIALGCMLGVLWVRPVDPWPKMRWIDIPVLLFLKIRLLLRAARLFGCGIETRPLSKGLLHQVVVPLLVLT